VTVTRGLKAKPPKFGVSANHRKNWYGEKEKGWFWFGIRKERMEEGNKGIKLVRRWSP